jgi:hypothetical protein
MLNTCLEDIESLEAITQDDATRDVCLRMAWMSRANRLQPFLSELERDDDLDEATKGMLTELAEDETFLLVVEDYVQRTEILH